MKAISLWQPWATAIAIGIKQIETRHWATRYRGPLAIHAARRWTPEQTQFASVEHTLGRLPSPLPFGAIVAVATLERVERTEDIVTKISALERLYGNYRPGRFAWILSDVRQLPEPIPYRGSRALFNVPDAVLRDAISASSAVLAPKTGA